MKEADLRAILGLLGIENRGRASHKGWISFRCPMAPWTHSRGTDRSASAAAKIETGKLSSWGCQTCKHHGTIHALARDLMGKRDGKINPEIMEKIATAEAGAMLQVREFGDLGQEEAALPPPPNRAMIDGLYPLAWSDPEARQYLLDRGITEETALKLELLYDAEDTSRIDGVEYLTPRVLFPIRDDKGDIYGFSGRALDPEVKPKIKDYLGLPKRHLILGEHRWRPGFPKLIVEGLFAYARMHEIGAEELADIGALLGSELTPEKLARLVAHGEAVYLMVDNDEAGEACLFGRIDPTTKKHQIEEGAIARLQGYVPVMVPDWPLREDDTPKTDPDELTLDEVKVMLQSWPFVLQRRKSR